MIDRPEIRMRGPVVDAPPGDDALALAAFYERLLGWPITQRHPGGWALLQSPEGLKIEIQGLSDYQRPAWPNASNEQQMMVHMDFSTDDVDAAVAWAIEAGATVAEHQPQPTCG